VKKIFNSRKFVFRVLGLLQGAVKFSLDTVYFTYLLQVSSFIVKSKIRKGLVFSSIHKTHRQAPIALFQFNSPF
jgi:hypothetical protein